MVLANRLPSAAIFLHSFRPFGNYARSDHTSDHTIMFLIDHECVWYSTRIVITSYN